RVQIGDASTVFWAEAQEGVDPAKAQVAEDLFAVWQGTPVDETKEAKKVGAILDDLARGKPISDVDPTLAKGVRFYVLGLSPNAARLSVRFWYEDSFGAIAEAFREHAADLLLEPPPKEARPGIWRLLIETATLRKSENIPPQLAGETFRAILTRSRYPATLLATILMRLRADGDVNAMRVAMLKAIVARNRRLDGRTSPTEDRLVSLDPD